MFPELRLNRERSAREVPTGSLRLGWETGIVTPLGVGITGSIIDE